MKSIQKKLKSTDIYLCNDELDELISIISKNKSVALTNRKYLVF
jgi:hypothetical protein